MTEQPDKLVIRTSDRTLYKRCRLQWDFSSKIRMDYEPARSKFYYDFGTAWHAALAEWYNPERWTTASVDDRAISAKQNFNASLNTQLKLYRDRGIDDIEMEHEFEGAMTLGPAMLDNYIPYSLEHDDFTPIRVEQEFEVQVTAINPLMSSLGELPAYWCYGAMGGWHATDTPCEQCIPIVYQGRVDALVQDLLGNYWIAEWKSAEKAPSESNRWLAMDAQSGSYAWALQKMLGIPIKGVIHRTTLKRAPEPPRILKGGRLSIDKRQYTNYQLFSAKLRDICTTGDIVNNPEAIQRRYNNALEEYGEYLEFLASPDAPKFIYNEQVTRNPNQIENIGKWIAAEAQEMLSDPDIFPNPSSINCSTCPFYGVSLAWQEGSDWQFILDSQFVKRNDAIAPTNSR